ncbi:MAG TPA: hypothetical protein VFQ39_15585 [Longimicrobium sp.]|nr:hypothetical protein [Longimicrobium sp.]
MDATLRAASQALARTQATIARSQQLLAVSEAVLDEARAALADVDVGDAVTEAAGDDLSPAAG